jgi:hypothetical protein
MRNQTGEVVTVTTRTLYAENLNTHQDLLGGKAAKACNRVGIRIILDADTNTAGLYPLDANKPQRIEVSISFIPEPTLSEQCGLQNKCQ